MSGRTKTLASESVENERRKLAKAHARIATLERLAREQADAIDTLRGGVKYKLPTGKPKPSPKGDRLRVIVSDTHGSHIDPGACKAFLADLATLQPAEVILLGDLMDCGGWLAKHHTMGYVAEAAGTFEEDVAATNQFLDAVQEAAPTARIWYVEGNHEARIVKSCLKMTDQSAADAAFLLRLWGCKAILQLEQRGIEFIPRDHLQPGLSVRGALKLGDWVYTHGMTAGRYAVNDAIGKLKTNVCMGHIHRRQTFTQQSATADVIEGYCFGCLCRFVPRYAETNTTNWAHGYGFQVVARDGGATTWSVPIVDGRSRLPYLTR